MQGKDQKQEVGIYTRELTLKMNSLFDIHLGDTSSPIHIS